MSSRSNSPFVPGACGIDSRFFDDNGDWKRGPLLKGTTSFEPREDVKNILVTGGEGFIGSWVVRHLAMTYQSSYNIVSFDKLDYCSSLDNTRMLRDAPNFKFFHGDVTNAGDVMKCLTIHQIDTIFHFAAQSHVDLSFGNSLNFTTNNVCGTDVVLRSATKVGIRRFIHVSTDEVYGEVEKDDPDLLEHSLLTPTNPYAASKAAAEMYVVAYSKSYSLPSIIVRSNNVYGPHQFPEKVIPKFANLLQRKRPLIIHGDGTHTRRYLYAADAADAFDTILHKGSIGQIYNVGSADEVSNLELCGKLLDIFGIHDKEGWIEYVQNRPFNDRRYAVDATKLKQLGWGQKTSFEDGLRATVQWYQEFPNWWGDISHVLTAFPEVQGKAVVPSRREKEIKDVIQLNLVPSGDHVLREATTGAQNGVAKKRKLDDLDA